MDTYDASTDLPIYNSSWGHYIHEHGNEFVAWGLSLFLGVVIVLTGGYCLYKWCVRRFPDVCPIIRYSNPNNYNFGYTEEHEMEQLQLRRKEPRLSGSAPRQFVSASQQSGSAPHHPGSAAFISLEETIPEVTTSGSEGGSEHSSEVRVRSRNGNNGSRPESAASDSSIPPRLPPRGDLHSDSNEK